MSSSEHEPLSFTITLLLLLGLTLTASTTLTPTASPNSPHREDARQETLLEAMSGEGHLDEPHPSSRRDEHTGISPTVSGFGLPGESEATTMSGSASLTSAGASGRRLSGYAPKRAKLKSTLERLPLIFIENQGQLDKQVAYYVQGQDKTIYFTPAGVTYVLGDSAGEERWAVKLDFVDANSDAYPVGKQKAGTSISYFKGAPEEWHTGLATYRRIVYEDLWPGIDLVYYGTVNQLKYEFIVQPGADPGQIRLSYRGAGVEADAAGDLVVTTPVGGFQDKAPVAYQKIGGRRVVVTADYALEGAEYGFKVGAYDRQQTLILDPAVLVYCGYLGGSASDEGYGIAVDDAGNAYVTGMTHSSASLGFPVTVGPDVTYGGSIDVFVVKIRGDGTGLDYCGYIGGSGSDRGRGIDVDAAGNAYVVGFTTSSQTDGFPLAVGPDLSHSGGTDTFVAKVQADGTGLGYCGYIGGSAHDYGENIAVDDAGNAYITGYTWSSETSFPVRIGPDLTYNGMEDVFVAKVQADGTGLAYSGYIGGSKEDIWPDIAVDESGSAYVTGRTRSPETSFPVAVGPDLVYNDDGTGDAFVAKVGADGSSLDYCGYIGGIYEENGKGIAVDGAGRAHVVGTAVSHETDGFPVIGGPDLGYSNGAFVAKVMSDGTGLLSCGYIGHAVPRDMALDEAGNIYIAGWTGATSDLPLVGGPDLTYNGGERDAWVAKLRADASGLDYSGYIGGSDIEIEVGTGIAVDTDGNAYVVGYTSSTESEGFPVEVGPDLTHNGSSDAFVAKIAAGPYSISGRIHDGNGDPISGVAVSAGGGGSATTDASGAYTITTLFTRTYVLSAKKSGHNFSPAVRVVRVPPDAINQDFTTAPIYGSLAGQITDQDSRAAVAGARVSVAGQAVRSDAGGNYTVPGLLPGLHNLYVSADGYEDYQGEIVIEADTSTAKDIDLAPIDVSGYYLPYPGGTTYECIQGNNNTSNTHHGTWSYAFDFDLDNGHDVVASQGGRVFDLEEGYTDACHDSTPKCMNSANYVRIRHSDGTSTLYWHLDYNGVLVDREDTVQRGEVIARADHTGHSTGPHLDFTRHEWGGWDSVPISFEDVSGDGVPKEDNSYTSGNYPPTQASSATEKTADTEPPRGSAQIRFTGQPTHTLVLSAFDYITDVSHVRLAATESGLQAAGWLSFTTRTTWTDPAAFAQYRDANGNVSAVVSDTVDAIGYEPLQAAFAVSPTVCVGQALSLTNQTSPFCEQSSWLWDFGNGAMSTQAEPQFDYVAMSSFPGYASPGIYTVTLTATNVVSSSTAAHQVEALSTPAAGFTLIQSGRTITVEAEALGAASWVWDFGDGTTANGRITTHTYSPTDALVTYRVKLMVEGQQGCPSFSHQFVNVVSNRVYLPLTLRNR